MKRVYLTVQCITYSFRVANTDRNILVLGYVLLQIKMKRVYLKEYSVILTTSFYDINQKILTKKGYFQSFS